MLRHPLSPAAAVLLLASWSPQAAAPCLPPPPQAYFLVYSSVSSLVILLASFMLVSLALYSSRRQMISFSLTWRGGVRCEGQLLASLVRISCEGGEGWW